MKREHDDALELLERALAYTRGTLATVGADRSGRTPCSAWSLADLLAHMDDGLDAFLEATAGAVRVRVPAHGGTDIAGLQAKACRLLGAWSSRTPPRQVLVDDRPMPAGLLISAAALEIAVHGWDVGRATGAPQDLPPELARALLPVARTVVTPDDRPGRFAAPRSARPDGGVRGDLLGFLGRG